MAAGTKIDAGYSGPYRPGELIDKLTILRLKAEKITDPAKLANVRHELAALQQTADVALPASAELSALWEQLYQINAALWVIEDDIRECESRSDFGPDFIRLARAVYVTNDQRASRMKSGPKSERDSHSRMSSSITQIGRAHI